MGSAQTENRDLVNQFCPSALEEAFIHFGRSVFNFVIFKQLQEMYERPPLRVEDDIAVFEEPANDFYGIGVDTAEGLAHGDNSVISVTRKTRGEEVAQVSGKISPHELARKLGILARMYPNHSCVIERNNHGHTVIAYAKEDGVIRLYQTGEVDKITNKITHKIGWDTNEKSKSYAIDTLSRTSKTGSAFRTRPRRTENFGHSCTASVGKWPGFKGSSTIG